jgi:hypothetical protein
MFTRELGTGGACCSPSLTMIALWWKGHWIAGFTIDSISKFEIKQDFLEQNVITTEVCMPSTTGATNFNMCFKLQSQFCQNLLEIKGLCAAKK